MTKSWVQFKISLFYSNPVKAFTSCKLPSKASMICHKPVVFHNFGSRHLNRLILWPACYNSSTPVAIPWGSTKAKNTWWWERMVSLSPPSALRLCCLLLFSLQTFFLLELLFPKTLFVSIELQQYWRINLQSKLNVQPKWNTFVPLKFDLVKLLPKLTIKMEKTTRCLLDHFWCLSL